jgi:uncharacterized membrane protein
LHLKANQRVKGRCTPINMPVAPPGFVFFIIVLLVLVLLIKIEVFRYVYPQPGISSSVALLLLFASLIGSYVNIPITQMSERQHGGGQIISYFGVPYVVPSVVDWPKIDDWLSVIRSTEKSISLR